MELILKVTNSSVEYSIVNDPKYYSLLEEDFGDTIKSFCEELQEFVKTQKQIPVVTHTIGIPIVNQMIKYDNDFTFYYHYDSYD